MDFFTAPNSFGNLITCFFLLIAVVPLLCLPSPFAVTVLTLILAAHHLLVVNLHNFVLLMSLFS